MQLLTSVLLSLLALVGTLVLLGEWDGGPGMVYAQSGTGVIRVAITGTDAIGCGGAVAPCRTVQYAVDQALPAEKVLVAQGIYTGVSVRAGITQVVYISKPVSIRGGYTIADGFAGPPDPTAYPTTLDARGLGRVLYITGTNALTIEGMRLTLGNAVAGEGPNADGGGAAIINTQATISNCWVFANVADSGGGLCLTGSNADLRGNLISTNSAVSAGGGLGISAGSEATLSGNVIISNTAGWGGGLDLNSGTATLINNFIVENQANSGGSGLNAIAGSGRLLHTTIAANNGGDAGVYVTDDGSVHSTIGLTNTILVGHNVGIDVNSGSTATLEATLWGDGNWINGVDVAGDGTVEPGTRNYRTHPAFVDPDAGDYHIGAGSKARDNGVDAGVITDIDGETRPIGAGYDLGADEFPFPWRYVHLPAMFRQYPQSSGVVHVAVTGADVPGCGGTMAPCHTVQYAVDQAIPGGEIRVAAGTYANVSVRAGMTQVVHISKTVTIRGGYTRTNAFAGWPDPDANPTILDAGDRGRVLFITGTIVFTMEGLGITGGNASAAAPYAPVAHGGGVLLSNATAVISNCRVWSNIAQIGGGLSLNGGNVVLINTLIVDNQASSGGSGLNAIASSSRLLYTTIAGNIGGGGIHVADEGSVYSIIELTNTILVSHSVGINVDAGNTATLEATLWGSGRWANGKDTDGPGAISVGVLNYWGDPAFVMPEGGDYHIGIGSAARDRGVDAGVTTDLDGNPRPVSAGYDLGAYEFQSKWRYLHLPTIMRQ